MLEVRTPFVYNKVDYGYNNEVLIMKLMTFTVPCYNSAEYMHICVDSLLKGGDEVEIILL